MNFFLQNAFGLDISDRSIKVIALKKTSAGLKLASFNDIEVRPGIIEQGEIKNAKAVAKLIQKLISKTNGRPIQTKKVICSLPEEKSFLDIIDLPKMKSEEVKNAILYEVENHIPLSVEQVYFDSEIIKPTADNPKNIEVLLVATPKKVIDPYLETLEIAKLQPKAFEIECESIARALVKQEKSYAPFLIIDFGKTRTSFIIFSGNNSRFTSTIPISSQKLTDMIAKNLEITKKKAEQLKIKQGLTKKGKVFDALIPPLTDLVEQIQIHINYYRSHEKKRNNSYKEEPLDKILLCGGGANLKGLSSFLSSELKIPVSVANIWTNIQREPLKGRAKLPAGKSLGYTTALGLALRDFIKN